MREGYERGCSLYRKAKHNTDKRERGAVDLYTEKHNTMLILIRKKHNTDT